MNPDSYTTGNLPFQPMLYFFPIAITVSRHELIYGMRRDYQSKFFIDMVAVTLWKMLHGWRIFREYFLSTIR